MPRPKRSQEILLEDALNDTYLEPIRKNKKKKTLTYEKISFPTSLVGRSSPGVSRHGIQTAQTAIVENDPHGYQVDDVLTHYLGPLPEKGKVNTSYHSHQGTK